MRPGQGPRRSRRNGSGHPHSHGGHGGHSGHSSSHQNSRAPRSAMSLRNQIFDSNGPDMRVRGNAFQVHEKYQALAKDALSSGDRILAENYLQHAEHYYRIIEAINEAAAAEQRLHQPAQQPGYMAPPGQQPQQQPPMGGGNGFYNSVGDMGSPQGGQGPMNNMRSPVTMESAAEPAAQTGAGEGEDDYSGQGAQAAVVGRR